MKSLNISIKGKLDKVGFKYFIKQRADKFNITGCIRYNNPNSIVVEASGNPDALDEFLEYCHLGTAFSEVKEVEVTEVHPKKHSTFEVSEYPITKNK